MVLRQGLTIVHTGNGKGKTTAALGLALRAWGNGCKVLILQFIKGGWKYGELKALAQLEPNIQIRQLGEGFTQRSSDDVQRQKHIEAARQALVTARQEMLSGRWDMLILDEINYAIKFGLLRSDEIINLLDDKPDSLHLVLTGRDAALELIERADLVTEMREIKHPYKQGIKAQSGIEF